MNVFGFVVRRLRWLARIPIAPQLFDSMLLAWTALRHRERLDFMREVEDRALDIPGVRLCVHRFGGIGFVMGNREIAHLHGNGLLDVHIGREMADALIRESRAEMHHVFGRSAWVSFWIRGQEHVVAAGDLIRCAAACEGGMLTAP